MTKVLSRLVYWETRFRILFFMRVQIWTRRFDSYLTKKFRVARAERLVCERRHAWEQVKWSREQRKEFDKFWKDNYGRKISSAWHRYFESSAGKFDVRYMPLNVFTPELRQVINNYDLACFCDAKTNLSILFDDSREDRCVPKHYGYKIWNYYYDAKRSIVSKQELAERLANVGECVFKKSNDKQGHGFRFYNFENGRDLSSGQTPLEAIESAKGDFVFQERIRQHPTYARLSPKSLNTIRLVTYVCEDKVYHAPMLIRFGIGDSDVDNFHAGGIAVGVSDDGLLNRTGWRTVSSGHFTPVTVNPNTGLILEGYQLPYVDQILDFAYKNHGKLPGIGMVSWDLVVTEKGNPMIIELNVSEQSVKFPQFIQGTPLFGANTDKMLYVLKNKNVLK